MANTKTYALDPNFLSQAALSGKAQVIPDPSSSFWSKLAAAANQQPGGYEVVDTTATSLAVDVYESQLVVSGTMTATLPDGTFIGQRKKVRCYSGASTPALTLTVTTPETATGWACSSTWFFDTAGQAVEFEWTKNSKWRAVEVKRAGGAANNVVIGTTVLTGKNLWLTYNTSVTGSVTSSTTKALPNGSAVGEICLVACSTAATCPVGVLDFVGTYLGAAVTHLGAIGATTDGCVLIWDGAAWEVASEAGLTIS